MTHQQILEQFAGPDAVKRFISQLERWRSGPEPTEDAMQMFSLSVVEALGKYREVWQVPGFAIATCAEWAVPIATGSDACVNWIERDCTGVGVPAVALAASGLDELRSTVILSVAAVLSGRRVFRPRESNAIANSISKYAASRIPEQNDRVVKHYELLLRIARAVSAIP